MNNAAPVAPAVIPARHGWSQMSVPLKFAFLRTVESKDIVCLNNEVKQVYLTLQIAEPSIDRKPLSFCKSGLLCKYFHSLRSKSSSHLARSCLNDGKSFVKHQIFL